MEFILKSVEKKEIYSGFYDYHYHKDEYLNLPKAKVPYMMGVELETLFRGDYVDNADERRDNWCDNCKSNWFFMEEDGSLGEGGCEFITTPLAPEDAKNPSTWAPLIKALHDANVVSYQSSDTGLHVHISTDALGTTEQEQQEAKLRLLYFYFYVLSASTRKRVFARNCGGYSEELRGEQAAAASKLKVALRYKEVRDAVCKELKDQVDCSRYYAINFENEDTVEFRQGKGSLNALRIASICEFVEACCLYVRKKKDISRYSEEDFLGTLPALCKNYCFNMGEQ